MRISETVSAQPTSRRNVSKEDGVLRKGTASWRPIRELPGKAGAEKQLVLYFCVLLFSVLLFLSVGASAQDGRVSGRVIDEQGAVIVSASVQINGRDVVLTKETSTDSVGRYAFRDLPPGQYAVKVEAPGFAKLISPDLIISLGADLIFEAKLTVETSTAEITVETQGNPVELDTSAVSGTLSAKEVSSLGLNGRNFTQLITLTPGVSNQTGQDEAKVGVAGSAKFSVDGGRVEYNTFEVDGSDVLNTSINASRGQAEPLIVYPSIDAIQELKVLTSNYGAEYGKSASGSVLVTTKSGTAEFHGNAYEFYPQ